MPRWVAALVALAAFGAGWIANDLATSTDCRAVDTTGQSLRERAASSDIAFRCD